MESLNNMKKTVLKLENEISEIGLNLTKVQKKEHSKMKSIIQNINKLLNKDTCKKNVISEKENNYLHDNKDDEKRDENINDNKNKYVNIKNSNIDCILISLKKPKNRNNNELNLNDETFFNNKKKTYAKIYLNKNTHLTTNEKILKINESDYENYKANTITNKINIKNINKSRNKSNLYYNHMTYSKPKLNNEFSKNNPNKKRNTTNSSNKIINNIFDINKIDTLIQVGGKNSSKSNPKYSTARNVKQKKIEVMNKNMNNGNNLNKFSKNHKKFHDENIFKKELLYNKDLFPSEQLETNYNPENNDENFQISERDISQTKSKNTILDLKAEECKNYNFSNNSKASSPLKKNNFVNSCKKSGIDFVKNKYFADQKFINDDIKNYIKSSERINTKINDEDLDMNPLNIKKKNYSRDSISKKYDELEEKNIKITKLLNMLKTKDIDEAISKVVKLIKLQKIIHKCKTIYDDENKHYLNNTKNIVEKSKHFQWLNEMVKNYKEYKIYKNFCETIMVNNKINHFDDFKMFINNILINNRKNNGFLVEVKNILLEDNYCANKRKGKSVNKINYGRNIKIINKINNKTFYDLENSNDIKFSRNNDNVELEEDWIKTYY